MIGVAVIAHNARAEQAHELMETVSARYMHMDNGTVGCTGSHRRAWAYLAKQDIEWGVCLEDDAVPVEGFTQQLEQALNASPCDVVSLYLGTSRPVWYQPTGERTALPLQRMIRLAIDKAEAQDACFITSRLLFHAVGVAIRTPLVPSMLKYLSTASRPIDYAISDWCEVNGHTIAYPVPSIVDHLDQQPVTQHPDRQPRNKPRKAWRHGTRTTWNNTTVELTDGLG